MQGTLEPMFMRIRRYVDEEAKISRKQLAINMGVTESQMSLLLSGKRQLRVDDYEKLCRAMSVDPKHFFV